ncbi:unnamed protein product [Fraxinus pennsylvanica]|uniref:DNA-directed DNA polymerase family A palm domain-containing protein n=1 Tax=Fraxinus pennsylvanica TaxID=56036 RepID=A0AAD2E280_9LAMI|nr:unnamed protein product [Fraxinus pennsylvanica]
MAKMGFSTQTNPFRPSSFSPPYFWFCRSCTNVYSSSSHTVWASSRKTLRRLEAFKLETASGSLSTGTLNVDSHQLKRRSSYSTMQHDESQIHYQRKYTYPSPHSKMPSVHRGGKRREDVNGEVCGSIVTLGHTAEAWGKAAEECKKNKALFAHKENIAVNLKTLPEEDTAKGAKLGVIEYSSECIKRYKGDGSRPISKEMEYSVNVGQVRPHVSHNPSFADNIRSNKEYMNNGDGSMSLQNRSLLEGALPNRLLLEDNVEHVKDEVSKIGNELGIDEIKNNAGYHKCIVADIANGTQIEQITRESKNTFERLRTVYDKVLVVDSISAAREVVGLLTNQYRHLVHACDTEAPKIDVKEETPVDHGEIICFSIYSGPDVDFGNGKSCVWVDLLDGGGKNLMAEFARFFEDSSIKKVWHNYSFDNHIVENYGLKVSGFFADTMHMARLWNSSRRTEGGYSLEALTGDPFVMSNAKLRLGEEMIGKVSMKTIFGRKKLKKDGSEGKIMVIPPVEELQRVERKLWICYSALDSMSTLKLYESLRSKLSKMPWNLDGVAKGSMFNFYEKYWRPFGELLVKMETEGMLVDRAYLAEVEKVAKAEQQVAADRFRKWASKHCPDAQYMNVGSDAQLRQFFFGGIQNRRNANEFLPLEKDFKIPNTDKIIEEGKKTPTKYRKITLHKPLDVNIEADVYTASGWPSVSGGVLKNLAGKVSVDYDFMDEESVEEVPNAGVGEAFKNPDKSDYGAAYTAFGGGQAGVEACHAIAALCEVCSIDSLISNFILPLQGNHISGKDWRIHCSLNINTETGRLSARRPNLQNQPALEKDRYKIRQAFIAAPDNSLIVADYGFLCGDFHSRTAMNMYPHIREAVEQKHVLLEWHPEPGEDKPPAPLLKDAFASERRKAKMLNFSIAYGKTTVGLARDWKVSIKEAKETVDRWYSDRQEVLSWQEKRKKEAVVNGCVHTLLGRARMFPSLRNATPWHKNHIERAAINTPVQGSAADVAMCAMLEISKNAQLKELGWRLLLQVHDEVILEGPTESAEVAKAIVVDCMSKPFDGKNILNVDLSVDAKCAKNWYSAK